VGNIRGTFLFEKEILKIKMNRGGRTGPGWIEKTIFVTCGWRLDQKELKEVNTTL